MCIRDSDYLCRFTVRVTYFGFSWKSIQLLGSIRRSYLSALIRQYAQPTCLRPLFSVSECRNINLLSIDYPSRVCLRSRLTLFWLTSNEETLVLRRTSFSLVLSLLMPTFAFVVSPPCLTAQLLPHYNAPLPIITNSIASVYRLMPDYFPRKNARLVSCYALFKWMAASKPTS